MKVVIMDRVDFVHSDWEYLQTFFATGWRKKIKDLGLLKFGRKFNGESLLRVLLMHVGGNISLRSTSTLAKNNGVADISDVGILKRLSKSHRYFSWMTDELIKELYHSQDIFERRLSQYRFRAVDGSVVKEPGATGSQWRLHYSMGLLDLSPDEIHVTSTKTGESLRNFNIKKNDVIIADRGYSSRENIFYTTDSNGYCVVRLIPSKMPLHNENGSSFQLIKKLRGLKKGQAGNFDVWIHLRGQRLKGRVCALLKDEEEIKKAQKALRSKASKQQRVLKELTLEYAKYIIIFTTLPMEISAQDVLLIYRWRWQIELLFKRLKSLVGVAPLYKRSEDAMKGWLAGKIFISTLVEYIIRCSDALFPWGYPLRSRDL